MPPFFNELQYFLAILILLVEIYRKLRQIWLRHLLLGKKKAKRPLKPPVLRPKSERVCRFCQLTRRTWGSAKYTLELVEQLEWWRSYYNFVRHHESMEDKLSQPA